MCSDVRSGNQRKLKVNKWSLSSDPRYAWLIATLPLRLQRLFAAWNTERLLNSSCLLNRVEDDWGLLDEGRNRKCHACLTTCLLRSFTEVCAWFLLYLFNFCAFLQLRNLSCGYLNIPISHSYSNSSCSTFLISFICKTQWFFAGTIFGPHPMIP